jgi:transposase-like protein
MRMNRVQFQPGLSMPEFLERYGTEALCREAVQAARWPSGFTCPACGGAARTSFERAGLRHWRCRRCDRQTSLISGTIFESSKLPLSRWFMAMQLLTQSKNNVSALELKRMLKVCYRSAWLMKHKILEAMRLAEADRRLEGRIERSTTPASAGSSPRARPGGAHSTRCPSWPPCRRPRTAIRFTPA